MELDDELFGKAPSSPLFIQEREEPANLRQAYHSHEESLLPAQSLFTRTRTGRPVHELGSCQNRKSSREMENERIRILLERQKEQILAEVGSEVQKHELQAESDRSIQELTRNIDSQRMEIDHAHNGGVSRRQFWLPSVVWRGEVRSVEVGAAAGDWWSEVDGRHLPLRKGVSELSETKWANSRSPAPGRLCTTHVRWKADVGLNTSDQAAVDSECTGVRPTQRVDADVRAPTYGADASLSNRLRDQDRVACLSSSQPLSRSLECPACCVLGDLSSKFGVHRHTRTRHTSSSN